MFLPECFDYVGENRNHSVSMAAPLDSPRMQGLCQLAKELGVWLSLGGYHEKVCTIYYLSKILHARKSTVCYMTKTESAMPYIYHHLTSQGFP